MDTTMKPNRQESESQRATAENALFFAVISLRTPTEARNFFRDLCTPAELQALVDRWQVVELLEQGFTYRRIHDLTAVSVTTIGRVARFLTDGHGGYRIAIDRASRLANPTSH